MAINISEITADTRLSKSQALEITEFSPTKFANPKLVEELTALGSTFEGTGKDWQINPEHLVQVGLLTPDFKPLNPRKTRAARGTKSTGSRVSAGRRSALEIAQGKVDSATEAVDKFTAKLNDAKADLKAAQKAYADAEKVEKEEAEQRRAALEARKAEIEAELAALSA